MWKIVNKREPVIASKLLENGLALDPNHNEIATNEEDLELENEESEVILPDNQQRDSIGPVDPDAPPDPEKIRQEVAAIKAQAAFRGYLVGVSLFLRTLTEFFNCLV